MRIRLGQRFPVQITIFVPFRHKHQRITAIGHFTDVLAGLDAHAAVFALESVEARSGSCTFTRTPRSISFCAISIAGASRKSSVFGLNARPSSPIVRPFQDLQFLQQLLDDAVALPGIDLARCLDNRHGASHIRRRLRSRLPYLCRSTNRPSRFRHSGNVDPIRESRPIPRATSVMFAPTRSPSSPISLMKLIFSARNAFAAYLISSAEARSVESRGTAPTVSGRGK